MKRVKILKLKAEAVNQRRTDNAMAKRNSWSTIATHKTKDIYLIHFST